MAKKWNEGNALVERTKGKGNEHAGFAAQATSASESIQVRNQFPLGNGIPHDE